MFKHRSSLSKAGGAAFLAAAVLLVTANPAAAEAGAGTSTGQFTTFNATDRDIEVPLCLQVTQAVLELDNVGTFTATEVGAVPPTAVFTGHTHAVVTMTTDYWFNPAGTFSDPLCTIPAVVGVDIDIVSPAAPGDVLCSGTGSYNRTGENAEVTTAVTNTSPTSSPGLTVGPGTATCEVADSLLGHTRTSNVILSFAGLQQPCLPAPLPSPCVSTTVGGVPVHTEFVGTYSEV